MTLITAKLMHRWRMRRLLRQLEPYKYAAGNGRASAPTSGRKLPGFDSNQPSG